MADARQPPDASLESFVPKSDNARCAVRSAVRFDRADWLGFGGTTVVAFAGYWFTLAPDVTLEWSGMLTTAATYAGVPSPPGLPVWILYSWLFTKLLPFANDAWRVAVGSAVASALACGLVAMMVSCGAPILLEDTSTLAHLTPSDRNRLRTGCGVIAGLVLAFSGVIWGEAVIADFWALSVLLFASVLLSLTIWMFEPERRRFLYAGFFLLGLLLTNSQEMIVALPALICAIFLARRKLGRDLALFVVPVVAIATALFQYGIWIVFPDKLNWPLLVAFAIVGLVGVSLVGFTRGVGSEWKATFVCGLCLLFGLAFYFYPPLASITSPPVNWGYPRTVEGFFHVLRRGQWEGLNPTHEIGRFVEQLWLYTTNAGRQFGWPQLAISILPFCFLGRMSPRGRLWMAGLCVVWICVAPLMIAELNPPLDRQAEELIELYFMASHVVLALWMGLGLTILGAWMTRPNPCPADLIRS